MLTNSARDNYYRVLMFIMRDCIHGTAVLSPRFLFVFHAISRNCCWSNLVGFEHLKLWRHGSDFLRQFWQKPWNYKINFTSVVSSLYGNERVWSIYRLWLPRWRGNTKKQIFTVIFKDSRTEIVNTFSTTKFS